MNKCYEILAITAVWAIALVAPLAAFAQEEKNFYDDFQGDSLNPAFRVLNPDPQRMTLTQREYLLLVTHKDTKNIIQYNRSLPDDYSVTIRLAQPPQNKQQWAHIRVGDATNNVRVGMNINIHINYEALHFDINKTLDGEEGNPLSKRNDALLGKPVYLRLEKIDVEFEGAYSTDGVQWTSLGKQMLIAPSAKVSIAVGGWGDATESPVKIDSFEITDISK